VRNDRLIAGGTIWLTVRADAHRVRIEVEDQGGGRPALRPATQNQADRRGLRVVDERATDWGTERATHKVIWCKIARRESRHAHDHGRRRRYAQMTAEYVDAVYDAPATSFGNSAVVCTTYCVQEARALLGSFSVSSA
jgi:hypothetical protein